MYFINLLLKNPHIIYLINKNKIKKSIFLPPFFNKIIDNYEKISKSKNLEYMRNFYYKNLYIQIFLFFGYLIYFFILFY